MSKSLPLMVCIVIGLLLLACAKQETNRNAAATTNATSPAPAGTPRSNANTATATATVEKVGVAECDNFIAAYESCVSSKVPESARGPLRAAANRWRTDWKRMADNPQTRAALVEACHRQMETARTQLKPYNCTF
jgi:hypothetical protein